MKFSVCSASTLKCRLGKIMEIQRLPGISFETPLFMLHTRGGSVPNITHEVLQMIFQQPLGIQVPLPTILLSEDSVRDYKKGLAHFIGQKECFVYCTVQDSAEVITSGFNDKNSVAVFTRHGRQQIDPDRYMDVMETFCPDMYQVLYDGETDKESSKKRTSNSVSRTSNFTERCLERHAKSENLQKTAVLGVVTGGYSTTAREASVRNLKEGPFSGFVIDGLHKGGPQIEDCCFDDIKTILEKTLDCLPPEKFRVIHGCWNPEVVLDLVELGIDIFDGSFPYHVSERGCALMFCNHIFDRHDSEHLADIHDDVKNCDSEDESDNKTYEINLKNKRYFDDLQPISKSCSCLVCKEHTRSYIHHLLMAKELLGAVLLTIHNLHHYMEFFKSIRRALKEERWQEYRKQFQTEMKKLGES